MRRVLPALLLALPLLLSPALATDVRAEGEVSEETAGSARRPLLWVLEEDGRAPTYLFGTIHIPDPRVTTLLDEVTEAFEASEVFFAEIEMDPGAMAALQPLMMLPAGQSLDAMLGEEVFARLLPVAEGLGLPGVMLPRFKAWVVAMMLMQKAMLPDPEDESADVAPAGAQAPQEPMDVVLYRNAAAQGKATGGLETLAEQVAVFDSLTQAEQVEMLVEFLDVIIEREGDDESDEGAADDLEDAYEALVRLYCAGDAEGLAAAIHAATEGESETLKRFMERLLDDRNVRMVERLLAAREDHPQKPMFVAVGAAHYPGSEGILAMLRAKGHAVRRLGRPAPAASGD